MTANQHLFDLFCNSVGLKPQTKKPEVMICHPGSIQGRLSDAGYKRRHEGSGESYLKRRYLIVKCPKCNKNFTAGSSHSQALYQLIKRHLTENNLFQFYRLGRNGAFFESHQGSETPSAYLLLNYSGSSADAVVGGKVYGVLFWF